MLCHQIQLIIYTKRQPILLFHFSNVVSNHKRPVHVQFSVLCFLINVFISFDWHVLAEIKWILVATHLRNLEKEEKQREQREIQSITSYLQPRRITLIFDDTFEWNFLSAMAI